MIIMNHEYIIELLEKEMVPALGCTDPAGIAFAAAFARSHGSGEVKRISCSLSANIIKNAAAVCIPRTNGRCGVGLAIALGAFGGDPKLGLEIFSGITEDQIQIAESFIASGQLHLQVADSEKKLYIKLEMETEKDLAEVVIQDRYTNIISLRVNGKEKIVAGSPFSEEADERSYPELSLSTILAFAETVPLEKLTIIEKAAEMNMIIAEEGMAGDYGISVGRNIRESVGQGVLAEDYSTTAMMWVAAATDARMAGCDIPVVSNTGSGNQGLASTIPVISIARKMGADYEQMIRALAISSLVTIYIKNRLGFLSAVCGAVIAGTGTACGAAYLLGGREAELLSAMKSVLGNAAGMVCDGAKAGCSMKVATCTQAGVLAALLAVKGYGIQGTDGVVDEEEEKTIDNFIQIATVGMEGMDRVLLDIILKKQL
jgi:L-cysteine desulfidase